MPSEFRSDSELAREFGARLKRFRVSERGAAMTQQELSRRTGLSQTAISRLETTGLASMMTVIAVLREFRLTDALLEAIPDMSGPSPMELLKGRRQPRQKAYAPRRRKSGRRRG